MTNPYTYDTGKKNAVVQVENTDNLIQGAASLTYNAFNKVATVVQGTNTLTITYGPDHQRTKTVLVNGSTTTTTLYADNYEQRTVNGTTTTYHYVASPDGLAAVYMKSGSTATAYYIETDHLGSIIRAYDYIGNTKFSAAYDAWGNQTVSTNAIGLTRGYTGHEHWNQFGLIDMNGRFYDPLLGRFLSPDPYVQAPDNPQNYNRYAYCLNNPLKYTDPSGEFFWIPFAIGAAIGAYTGYKIADANGYNLGDWQTYGYIVGGAFIGGMSGAAGAEIAAGGGVMANTMSIMVASHINSTGMKCLSGGRTDYTLSFGVASYNFTQGKWGYLGKKGNKPIENIGYGLGTIANVSDILKGFHSDDIQIQFENTPDAYESGKDKIGHVQVLDNDSNSLIDFGPKGNFFKFDKGVNNWVEYASNGRLQQTIDIPGNIFKEPITIKGVNLNILQKYSNWLKNKPGFYNFALRSCSTQAARGLTLSGVPVLGTHPYLLRFQIVNGLRPYMFNYTYTN